MKVRLRAPRLFIIWWLFGGTIPRSKCRYALLKCFRVLSRRMEEPEWLFNLPPPPTLPAAPTSICPCPGCVKPAETSTTRKQLSTLDPLFIPHNDPDYLNDILANWRLHLSNTAYHSEHRPVQSFANDVCSLIVRSLEPLKSLTASRAPCEDEDGKESTFRHEGLVLDERLFKVVQKTCRSLLTAAMPNKEVQLVADCYRQSLYAHESDLRRDRLVWLAQVLWHAFGKDDSNASFLTVEGLEVLRHGGKLCLDVGLSEEAVCYLSTCLRALRARTSSQAKLMIVDAGDQLDIRSLLDDLTTAYTLRHELKKALNSASEALQTAMSDVLQIEDQLTYLHLIALLAVLSGDEQAAAHLSRCLEMGNSVWSPAAAERHKSVAAFLMGNLATFRNVHLVFSALRVVDIHSGSGLQEMVRNGTLAIARQAAGEFSAGLQIKLFDEYVLLLNCGDLPLQVWRTVDIYRLTIPQAAVRMGHIERLLEKSALLPSLQLVINQWQPEIGYILHRSLVCLQKVSSGRPLLQLQFIEAAILYALAAWTMGECSEVAESYAQQALLLQVSICPTGHPAICASLQILAEIADWRGEREDAARLVARIRDSKEFADIWTSKSHLDWC